MGHITSIHFTKVVSTNGGLLNHKKQWQLKGAIKTKMISWGTSLKN